MSTHVLVIEDDEGIRLALRMLLEAEGYAVAAAVDGKQALALLDMSQEGWVVVFDYRMPRLDGEALLALAEHEGWLAERHVFVCLTASPHRLPPTLSALLARYQVPLVGKPFDLDDLLAAVQQAEQRLILRSPQMRHSPRRLLDAAHACLTALLGWQQGKHI